MKRLVVATEHVAALLDLFRRDGGVFFLSQNHFENTLRVVCRVTLQVSIAVTEAAQAPEEHHFSLDMLRDDIRSVLDAFFEVELVAAGIPGINVKQWSWSAVPTWSEFVKTFESQLVGLRSSSLLSDRYAFLLHLIRLQIILLGMTFGANHVGYMQPPTDRS